MALPSDILIGLDAGATKVEAVAFTVDGRELARAALRTDVHRVAGGGVEQDPGETWLAAAGAVRRLADGVPGLATRTAALAITGQDDSTCLIDEDGDVLTRAWLAPDGRAAAVVERWDRAGIGSNVRQITGSAARPSSQSAQIAWLRHHRPEVLDQAVAVLHGKDWLYLCATGERATDPAEGAGTYGDFATGTYDPRVLELLGLEDVERLLPEIVDGTRHHGALTRAAAAATGLASGTPVVLGPANTVAAALAAGIDAGSTHLGGTIVGANIVLMRAYGDLAAARASLGQVDALMPLPQPGSWLGVVRQVAGSANVDWLVGLAEELLVDAGLIGLARGDLRAMLERRAAEARPGVVRFAADGNRGECHGLSGETTFYDLLRGVYESLGLATRSSCAALDLRPAEVRIMGDGAFSPLGRQILAACVSAPLRALGRENPAAAGCALVAAVCLGHYGSVPRGFGDWVEPHLAAPEPVDPELRAVYKQLFAGRHEHPPATSTATVGGA